MKLLGALLVSALLLVAPAQAQTEDQAFFRLGFGQTSLTTTPPDFERDYELDDGSFAYSAIESIANDGSRTAVPMDFDPPGLESHGFAWATNSHEGAELDATTGYVTWDTSAFTGTRSVTVAMFTTADHSKAVEATSTIEVIDDAGEIPNPAPGGSFTYAPISASFGGGDRTATPIGFDPPGVQIYGYAWYANGSEFATLDESTGVVTWDTDSFQGTESVAVSAYITPDHSWSIEGTSTITVSGSYTITTTPDDYSVQWGTTGATATFTASTVPPQPATGETWSLDYRDYYGTPWLEQTDNVAVYDADARWADETHPYEPTLYQFRFKRVVDGITTYGDWVDFDLTRWPYFGYPLGTTSNYRIAVNETDPSAFYYQVKAGVPISIPATPRLGADEVAGNPPAFVYAQGTDLPPGLSIAADGTISGTASGPVDVRYSGFRVPVVNDQGVIYGMTEMTFAVVSEFVPDMWDLPDVHLPPPDPEDPDDDPSTPPPTWIFDQHYLAVTCGPKNMIEACGRPFDEANSSTFHTFGPFFSEPNGDPPMSVIGEVQTFLSTCDGYETGIGDYIKTWGYGDWDYVEAGPNFCSMFDLP